MRNIIWTILVTAALAGSAMGTATAAATPTYSIPSQAPFNHNFGLQGPGKVLDLDVVPDINIVGLTAGVDNGSSAGWSGGPHYTCTIPANFAGAHRGRFSGTYRRLGSEGVGGINKWNGGAQSDVLRLVSTAVAAFPSNKNRLIVGAGEEVEITTDPPTSVAWALSGGGKLSRLSGISTRFTAPGSATSPTVTATLSQQSVQLQYSVIIPDRVTMTVSSPFYHQQGIPSAGFTGRAITFYPLTVSFENVEVREDSVNAVATGCFASMHPHQAGTWVPILTGNLWAAPDSIGFTAGHIVPGPDKSGTCLWAIPWLYRVIGTSGNGLPLMTVDQTGVSDTSGRTTTSKCGASKPFNLNDPTQP